VGASAVGKFKVCFLPVRIVGEVRANEDNDLRHLNGNAEADLKLKILTKTASPRVEGVCAVVRVVANTVYSVTLEEAGLLTGNEIRPSVGEVFRYVVSVVGVKRDKSLTVYLGLIGLGKNDSVVVSRECAGSVAGLQFSAKGNSKLKYAVGKIDDRLLQARIKANLQEVRFAIDLELVTFFVFAVKMLVNFIAEGFEFNVAVLTYKL
jgi:hypothetical protein